MAFKTGLLSVIESLLTGYLLLCLFMWAYQRHLMYLPDQTIHEPAFYGLQDFDNVRLTDADGTQVYAWYHKAAEGYPTIVYFHGNGGNIAGRKHFFRLLADEGFGVMALDYRGYGESEGSPSEAGFYQDARAAIEYCTKRLALKPERLVAYGESIGTGVAVQMATEYPFAGLVLQSPYTSLLALGQASYPWLPVSLLQIDRFDSLSKIERVHAPLLLLHGELDSIVPVAHGRMLYEHAPGPKQAVYFPDKGHVNMDVQRLAQAVLEFSRKQGIVTKP